MYGKLLLCLNNQNENKKNCCLSHLWKSSGLIILTSTCVQQAGSLGHEPGQQPACSAVEVSLPGAVLSGGGRSSGHLAGADRIAAA